MKKLGFVLLLVAALASPAMADQVQVGYSGSSYGPYQTGRGGEFTLNPLTSWLDLSGYVDGTTKNIGENGTFQTFCIEGNEYIYGYPTIYSAKVDTYAENGGMGGQTEANKDYVSVGTGWLYSQFAQGTLAGYGAVGRLASAGALQNALWWLEGEELIVNDGTNLYINAVVTQFGGEAGAKANGAEQYGVYALNIWTDSGKGQTQLFYAVPDGGATLMLLGGALMGLGALRRKFRA
jgi:hypothetical protein